MNILLIAGGWSNEREVSLNGAQCISAALESLGHRVTLFDPVLSLSDLTKAAQGNDFAFINLHGSPGEDGLAQAMLEELGLPYQGSGPAGSFLALNKAAAKTLFKNSGLNTPDWVLLVRKPSAGWKPPFGFPLFIKSNSGGSSLNMERVESVKDLSGALERLFAQGGEFLVEPACEGVDVTCGVLGRLEKRGETTLEVPCALPPILIRPKQSRVFFDYASKYQHGGAEEICPAPIAPETSATIQHMAVAAHQSLGLKNYSRADFILQPDGKAVLLEINTLPGMTSTSLVPQEAAAIGLSFPDLLERLLELGLATRRK